MEEIKILNFMPANESSSWQIESKDGLWFKATSFSDDGMCICTYYLNSEKEVVYIKEVDPAEKNGVKLLSSRYNLMPNNGSGIVRLSEGDIMSRYGHYTHKEFSFLSDLDKYHLSLEEKPAYDLTVDHTAAGNTRVILPQGGTAIVSDLNGNKKFYGPIVVYTGLNKTKLVHINDDCEWWVYEISMLTEKIKRILYIQDPNRLAEFEPAIAEAVGRGKA